MPRRQSKIEFISVELADSGQNCKLERKTVLFENGCVLEVSNNEVMTRQNICAVSLSVSKNCVCGEWYFGFLRGNHTRRGNRAPTICCGSEKEGVRPFLTVGGNAHVEPHFGRMCEKPVLAVCQKGLSCGNAFRQYRNIFRYCRNSTYISTMPKLNVEIEFLNVEIEFLGLARP